jgi:hypothetical protein
MKVMIFHFNSGFLSIAQIAPAISFHSQIQAQSHAKPIARPAPIDAVRLKVSEPRIWNAIIKP